MGRQWFPYVRAGVLERVERMVARAARDGALPAAEALVVLGAWQALLERHGGPDGRCVLCRRTSRRLCGVWQVAVAYFVRPDAP
ncbi:MULTISPECIES: hypothetical protein [Amycolatopsis]|uniref:Uncharacterized protein n=2 Tax=Amycolatopsis TaxID=1813 RepID=A0A3N2GVW1_9PSEU|nr:MULTISPECIES: hypothetical protein [Amycolatopsis]MCF6427420.1 hypothetical protein [Amycolatopsis tucumanensis]ROS40299.1 hypothetical protein EDD35_2631 [Amycolatopsis thermoflava]